MGKWINGFFLEYSWYEGEHNSVLITTTRSAEEFEELLKKGINEINTYPETHKLSDARSGKKAFSVKCLPEAWDKLIRYLEKNKCQTVLVYYDRYDVDDSDTANRAFTVRRVETIPKRTCLLTEKKQKITKL